MENERKFLIPQKEWDKIFEKAPLKSAIFAAALDIYLRALKTNPSASLPINLGKREKGKAVTFYPYGKDDEMRLVASRNGSDFVFEKFVTHKTQQYQTAISNASKCSKLRQDMVDSATAHKTFIENNSLAQAVSEAHVIPNKKIKAKGQTKKEMSREDLVFMNAAGRGHKVM